MVKGIPLCSIHAFSSCTHLQSCLYEVFSCWMVLMETCSPRLLRYLLNSFYGFRRQLEQVIIILFPDDPQEWTRCALITFQFSVIKFIVHLFLLLCSKNNQFIKCSFFWEMLFSLLIFELLQHLFHFIHIPWDFKALWTMFCAGSTSNTCRRQFILGKNHQTGKPPGSSDFCFVVSL